MRVSLEKKFVFLAYPRTGSRSIQSVLDPYSQIKSKHLSEVDDSHPFHHHMTARDAHAVFEREGMSWSEFRSFCVIRNPFARLLSLYQRRMEYEREWDVRIRPLSNIHTFLIRTLPARAGFSFFILTRNPFRGVACNLETFILSRDRIQLVDDLLRFEDLQTDLIKQLGRLGIPVKSDEIPHLNRSTAYRPYREWYNDLTRRRVRRFYQYELDRFEYSY